MKGGALLDNESHVRLIRNRKQKAPELEWDREYIQVDEDGEYRNFGGCPTVNRITADIYKT
jgi:hypothetical protein